MYNEAFPLSEDKIRQKNRKSWLGDGKEEEGTVLQKGQGVKETLGDANADERGLGLQGGQVDVHEGIMARFQNELGDISNEAFPLSEDKRKQKDRKKSWLDDPQF